MLKHATFREISGQPGKDIGRPDRCLTMEGHFIERGKMVCTLLELVHKLKFSLASELLSHDLHWGRHVVCHLKTQQTAALSPI